ncbi:MAG: hypothetical protein H0X73_02975 [Chthoniobacterales bacterium]|nr:hypothetical protein [Chthoniobacterales bacterium]
MISFGHIAGGSNCFSCCSPTLKAEANAADIAIKIGDKKDGLDEFPAGAGVVPLVNILFYDHVQKD